MLPISVVWVNNSASWNSKSSSSDLPSTASSIRSWFVNQSSARIRSLPKAQLLRKKSKCCMLWPKGKGRFSDCLSRLIAPQVRIFWAWSTSSRPFARFPRTQKISWAERLISSSAPSQMGYFCVHLCVPERAVLEPWGRGCLRRGSDWVILFVNSTKL